MVCLPDWTKGKKFLEVMIICRPSRHITLGRAASGRRTLICHCSIDGARVEQESEPATALPPDLQTPSSTKVTADYRRCCVIELPVLCNRDDHLVRTLVTARCSALYLRTNFV